jgi:hypothetical protein
VDVSNRGVSTALDATLCLLLVSAAVVALVTVPGGDATADAPGDVRSTAGALGASTATVEGSNGSSTRTVANHLADAALLDASDRSAPAFEAGVRKATERTLATVPGETAVVAVARDGNRSVGRFAVGDSPPSAATVESSSFSVPAPGSERAERVRIVVRGWSA